MATGKFRFLFENRITAASQITVSSLKDGHPEGAVKRGTGSATINTTGIFTGTSTIKYTIIIDDITPGQEIGQATYEWLKDDVAQASGITTAGATILSDGVSISFTGGNSDDFELGDQWDFYAVNEFSPSNIFDLDRDSRYRSTDGSASAGDVIIEFDFGSPVTFDSFVSLDHNLTSNATITLEANTSASWGAPPFSQAITWKADKILQYFSSQTYQHARIVYSDPTNPDNYIEQSEAYIGPYEEFSRAMPTSFSEEKEFIIDRQETPFGVIRRQYKGERRLVKFTVNFMTEADENAIFDMQDTIINASDQTIMPIYYNLDSEDVEEFWLMELNAIPITVPHGKQNEIYHSIVFDLKEIVRSVQ
jgi:hypothetical protein